MSYNKLFELAVNDIALIEDALRSMPPSKEINNLLGRIHNQKNWYRPKNSTYISG